VLDIGTAQYLQRNFHRWLKQYEASKTGEIDSMNRLIEWLPQNMPASQATTLIHGDFRFTYSIMCIKPTLNAFLARLDNLIFHPTKPEVIAVLDWELSTLGDPVTDLANNCIPLYFSSAVPRGTGVIPCKPYSYPSQCFLIAMWLHSFRRCGNRDTRNPSGGRVHAGVPQSHWRIGCPRLAFLCGFHIFPCVCYSTRCLQEIHNG
jgi:hypothetical protein